MNITKELVDKIEKDFSGVSICVTDANLDLPGPQIIYVSPAFEKLTCYTQEEVVGKTPRIFQGPHTERVVLDRLKRDLKENGVFQGSAVNYRKDGTEFYMAWSIMPIKDANDAVIAYIATQNDATGTMVIKSLRQIEVSQRSILESLLKLERLI